MNTISLPDQIKQESIAKITFIANQMLKDEINLVKGSREISRLRLNIDNPDDDVFNIFILVTSDTDDVPLEDNVRKNFGPDYLKDKDKKLNEYIGDMKQKIIEGCRKIIKRFSEKQ